MVGFISDCLTYLGFAVILYKLLANILAKLTRGAKIEDFKYGWIVITGATAGIGYEFAKQLVSKGFKVILISRDAGKLQSVKEELVSLSDEKNIVVMPIDFKFSHRDPENFYSTLMQKLSGYEVSGLINNVGVMPELKHFPQCEQAEIESTIGVNIYPMTFLTHFVIPQMIERFSKTKQRSLIINLGSVAAQKPAPGFNVYGSTKRYVDFFGTAISYEYDSAIQFVTAGPNVVETSMPATFNLNTSVATNPITTKEFVSSVFENLHKRCMAGHVKHEIPKMLTELVPDWLFFRAASIIIPWSYPAFRNLEIPTSK